MKCIVLCDEELVLETEDWEYAQDCASKLQALDYPAYAYQIGGK